MPNEILALVNGWHQLDGRWYAVTGHRLDLSCTSWRHWPLPAGWSAPWEWLP